MSFTIGVTGLAELKQSLAAMEDRVARRHIVVALNAGASTIREQAVTNAPEFHGEVSKGHPPPGTLKRSVKIKTARAPRGSATVQIYVRSGGKNKRLDAYYWRWVEFGHFTRSSGGRLRNTGRGQANNARLAADVQSGAVKWIPANPFMRRAFDGKKEAAVTRFRDKLRERMQAEEGLR